MNRRTVFAITSAVAILPCSGFVLAQTPAHDDHGKHPVLLAGGLSHLARQIVIERPSSGAVRAFTASEAGEQRAIATGCGVTPCNQVTADHAAAIEALKAMQAGTGFDRMYANSQIAAHEQVRALHAAYATGSGDPMAQGASMIAFPIHRYSHP